MDDRCPICDERLSEIDRAHVCRASASIDESVKGTALDRDYLMSLNTIIRAAELRGKIEGLKEAESITRMYCNKRALNDIQKKLAILQEPRS